MFDGLVLQVRRDELAALAVRGYAQPVNAIRNSGVDLDQGTLELVAGHPISRRRLATERLAAMLASIVGICIAFLVVMLLVRPVADLGEISIGGFIANSATDETTARMLGFARLWATACPTAEYTWLPRVPIAIAPTAISARSG